MYGSKYVCLHFSNHNRLFIKSFVLYSTFYQLAITRWQKGAVMERLTNSDKEIPTLDDNAEYWLKAYLKLKDYEDLEEQGRLLKLPCRVGDTVYGISMGKIITLIVNEISIFYMKGEKIINVKCQNDDMFRNYIETEFGKTVFLTKSEAEAKLKKLRGGND